MIFDKDARPRFGIMHDFRRPSDHPSTTAEYYAQCLAEAEEADRLGYEAVWLPEHHFTDDGMLPSPLVVAAAIAARTHRIGIGTNVSRAATAPSIARRRGRCRGRPDLRRPAGARGRPGIRARGVRRARRRPLLVGAVAEPAVERAVRIGDGPIVYCGKPADFLARRQLIDRVLAANPRRDFPVVLTSILHVAADAEQAWEEARPGIAYLEGQLGNLRNTSQTSFDRADFLVGTPTEVADRLAALHRQAPFDHFAHWARLPSLPHQRAVETLHLVAEQVIPAVH